MNKCFQFSVILLLLQALPYARADAPPSPKWLAGITRVAYTDLSNSHRRADWPDRVILDFASAGVQMMFSRVHNGRDAPGLGWRSAYGEADPAMQGRDGTREVVALCRKRNIRYLAYYWAQMEPDSLGAAHPDWRMLNSAGKPNGYYCGNAGYRDLVRNRIVELVKDVGVDGIFFDMYHAVGNACYCPACKAKFCAQTGQDPPVKEDFDSLLWQQWVEFKYRSIEEALLDFNRAIKAANPDAALLVNSWNAWVYRNTGNLRSSIRVAECVDGLLEETGWYDTVDPSFFAFPARMSFMNWHLAGLCKGKRAFMWGAPSLPGWLPLGYQEPAIRVMTMMTNGCVPAHSLPGRDVMARHMAEIAAREEYLRDARLHPWCGLVVSEKTEQWYGRDDPIIRRTLEVRDVSLPVDTVSRSVPLHGRMLLVASTNGTPSALRLKTSTRDATSGAATLQTTVAMVESTYGKGRVIYLPCDVSGAYFRYGHEYLARLMELALRQVAAEPPPVEVEAPSIIEAMPQVQGERLLVHLLNDISSFGRSQNVAGESLYLRREVIPVHDIAVTFRDRDWRRFSLVPGKTPLTPVQTPQGLKVIVPRLETHCMIVAESDHAGQSPGTTTVRVACREEPVAGKTRSGESGVLERQAGGADDLLRDGSCEQGNGGTLACWHLAQPRGGTVVIGACTENPRNGAACMSLRGIADWACGESERIAVRKGNAYKLPGWARATRGDVFLQISYWRGNEWLGLTQSDAVTTDGQWQQCMASTEPDRFADATHVSISGTARGGNVEAWFDAMVFTPETSPRKP